MASKDKNAKSTTSTTTTTANTQTTAFTNTTTADVNTSNNNTNNFSTGIGTGSQGLSASVFGQLHKLSTPSTITSSTSSPTTAQRLTLLEAHADNLFKSIENTNNRVTNIESLVEKLVTTTNNTNENLVKMQQLMTTFMKETNDKIDTISLKLQRISLAETNNNDSKAEAQDDHKSITADQQQDDKQTNLASNTSSSFASSSIAENDNTSSVFTDYVAYLNKLNELYPFNRKYKLYNGWYGINSGWQRTMTWFYIGMLLNFNKSLYPSIARQWWNEQRTANGLREIPLSEFSKKTYRPGSGVGSIATPAMSFVKGAIGYEDKWSTDVDVDINTETVSHFPDSMIMRPLPSEYPFYTNAGRFPMTSKELVLKVCTMKLNYIRVHHIEEEYIKDNYTSISDEINAPNNNNYHNSNNNDETATHYAHSSGIDSTVPPKGREKQRGSIDDCPPLQADYYSADNISNTSNVTYEKSNDISFKPNTKTNNAPLRNTNTVHYELDPRITVVPTEQYEKYGLVRRGGVIPLLVSLLPPTIKNVTLATRDATTSYYNQRVDKWRSIVAEVKATLLRLAFTGDEMSAPIYFEEYIVLVCKTDISSPDAVSVMLDSTTSSAKDWVRDTINKRMEAKTSADGDDFVLRGLIVSFKQHYLNSTLTNKLKQKLQDLSLATQTRANISEMEQHQGAFLKLKRCLMICELSVTESEMIDKLIRSLPSTMQYQLITRKRELKTTEDVFKMCQELAGVAERFTRMTSVPTTMSSSLASSTPTRRIKTTAANAADVMYATNDEYAHTNMFPYEYSSHSSYALNTPNYYEEVNDAQDNPTEPNVEYVDPSSLTYCHQQYLLDCNYVDSIVGFDAFNTRKYNDMSKVKCFHCGISGHYAGDCDRNDGTIASQTIAGKHAYVNFQQQTGTSTSYDPMLCKRKALERKSRQASNNKYRDSTTTNKRFNNNNNKNTDSFNKKKVLFSPQPRKQELNKNTTGSNKPANTTNNNSIEVNAVSESNVKYEEHNNDEEDTVDDLEFSCIIVTQYAISCEDELDEAARLAMYEQKAAESMCIPIEMNGINLNYALVDPGANRGIIRKSTVERSGLKNKVTITPVNNHYMRGSTGELIPITGRFVGKVTINGHEFAHSCFYVVDDTDKADIMCDVVIGRSTIASSNYPLLDNKEGKLYNNSLTQYIQCADACTARGDQGKPIVRPRSTERRPKWSC